MQASWEDSANWAASWVRGAAEAIQKEIKFTFEDFSCHVACVRSNLLAAEFPTRSRQHWLAARLNRDHPGSYLVVNLSGASYDQYELRGPVMDIVMSGCVPPLEVLLRLCVSAHRWLSKTVQNVVVAHGAKDRSFLSQHSLSHSGGHSPAGPGMYPVVLLYACYLSWAGLADHPKEGMLEVCKALGISEEVWPSQNRYLTYFELLQRGQVDLTKQDRVQLARIVLMDFDHALQHRAVEVWQQDQLVFREEVSKDDHICQTSALHVGVPVHGDLSVRVLLSEAAGDWQVEVQVCFHTAFVSLAGGFARFGAREMDVPSSKTLSESCALDVFLDPAPSEEAEDEQQQQQHSAASAAMTAAAEGPTAQFFDLAADDAEDPPEEVPSSSGLSVLAPGGASANRFTVFAPDDIDAFFDEL